MFGGLFAGLGTGLLSGALGFFGNRYAQARNESNSWAMWNAQNAYNHPAAVMQRLKSAGLNPNLAYGHMPMGSAPISVPHASAPDTPRFDFNLYQNLENMQLQNDSLREQIQNQRQMRANMMTDQFWKSRLSEDNHILNGINADQARLNLGLNRLDAALYGQYGSRAAYDFATQRELSLGRQADYILTQGLWNAATGLAGKTGGLLGKGWDKAGGWFKNWWNKGGSGVAKKALGKR